MNRELAEIRTAPDERALAQVLMRGIETDLSVATLRQMPPSQKLVLASELTAVIQDSVRDRYDRWYPDETQDQREERFLAMWWNDKDLARKFVVHRREITSRNRA